MTADRQCPHCGRELTAESLEGLCPYCVAYGLLSGEPVVGGQGSELRDQKSDATARSPLVRSFGDYELLEEIARGGMGVIYKARQKSLNRLVAVKMLLGGGHVGPKFRQRFSTEAEAAAQLHHPNIVAVHEVGEHEGTPFFSMDYVDGPDLERMTGHQPIAVERAARYVRTIAKAIHYAHQHGILHRDLKPSNVLVDSDDRVQITDFGLAKVLTSDTELTQSGQVLGSPHFLPPEQVRMKRGTVGPASDVYGAGSILYYLLTGRPPFVAEELPDVLEQVLKAEPVRPRLLNPSVPRDLETICLKCLEKDPQRRYPSAELLAFDLECWLRRKPIQARPGTTWEHVVKWTVRNPAIAALTGALLIVAVAGAGGVLWQGELADAALRSAQQAHVEAANWCRKAADQGDAVAQGQLGVCYRNGIGVPRDSVEAVKWLRKAAEQGDAKAQFNLGVCYARGQGIAVDKVEAHKWLDLALSQGVVKARELISTVERQMTQEQIAEAQRLVREFQPRKASAPGTDR
jgi:predicted Ser/Thr protein kinase